MGALLANYVEGNYPSGDLGTGVSAWAGVIKMVIAAAGGVIGIFCLGSCGIMSFEHLLW